MAHTDHAFLVIAHSDFEVLRLQLSLLDTPRSHFYVHIDKKAGDVPFGLLAKSVAKGTLHFVKRHSIRWGTSSQVYAYLQLLKEAGPSYGWYHFLSGSCLPVRHVGDILSYYDSLSGTDVVMDIDEGESRRHRLQYYYLSRNPIITRILCAVQRRFGIDRLPAVRRYFPQLYYGSAWFDINGRGRDAILAQEHAIRTIAAYTSCADEMIFHTLLGNSDLSISCDYKRFIDWSDCRPSPGILTADHYEAIVSSGCLFARKFDSKISKSLIHLLTTQ